MVLQDSVAGDCRSVGVIDLEMRRSVTLRPYGPSCKTLSLS